MLVSCLAYSSTLKIRHVPPKRRLTQQTTRYISEDRTLHNQRCENLRSLLHMAQWNFAVSIHRIVRIIKVKMDWTLGTGKESKTDHVFGINW
jgi:hypothetical protein